MEEKDGAVSGKERGLLGRIVVIGFSVMTGFA